MKWLELEGARAIVSAPTEHPIPENPPVSPFQKEE